MFTSYEIHSFPHTKEYIELCIKAKESDYFFNEFKHIKAYSDIVEINKESIGYEYAQKIYRDFPELFLMLDELKKNDLIGNPTTFNYKLFGKMSPSTLRYIYIAGDIEEKFPELPTNPNILELGAGYGGQCFILSKILPYATYSIVDLKPVLRLIEKYLYFHDVQNITLLTHEDITEDPIDLFISNYAFSLFSTSMQLMYFHRFIKYAKQGYILFSQKEENIGLSLDEFLNLLHNEGISPLISPEPVQTSPSNKNVLITWINHNIVD